MDNMYIILAWHLGHLPINQTFAFSVLK